MHPKAILESLGIRARKSLSQNFLTSPHWAQKLTAPALAAPQATEIWEIGPGLGALTTVLAEKSPLPIRLFEYDRALAAYLRTQFPHIELHEGDFLDVDLPKLLEGRPKVSLVSNVPYHVSSSLLFMLLPHREHFIRFVLTFQREFAERLSAKPRTENYAGLSVMIQTFFVIEPFGIMPPGAFYPVPGVDSTAVMLTPRFDTPDFPTFERLIRTSFAHRRKKVASNLRALYPDRDCEALLARLSHSPQARPEELSREDYVRLAQLLASD